jgi:hypothetical protein
VPNVGAGTKNKNWCRMKQTACRVHGRTTDPIPVASRVQVPQEDTPPGVEEDEEEII